MFLLTHYPIVTLVLEIFGGSAGNCGQCEKLKTEQTCGAKVSSRGVRVTSQSVGEKAGRTGLMPPPLRDGAEK